MAPLLRATCLALALFALVRYETPAQLVTVGTPLVGVQDSYYESFNIGWGFSWWGPRGGTFFNFGGPGSAVPPFGGFNPNAGGQFGVAQRWGNGSFNFGFSAGTGRSTTLTSSAPSLTVMNGAPGFFQDVTMRPFVVGLIPVVGGYSAMPMFAAPYAPVFPPAFGGSMVTPVFRPTSPLEERLARLRAEPPRPAPRDADATLDLTVEGGDAAVETEIVSVASSRSSTAEQGDISVAEIRRQRAEQQEKERREIAALIAEAKAAEAAGQAAIARVRYRQAAARSDGQQRQELLDAANRQKSP